MGFQDIIRLLTSDFQPQILAYTEYIRERWGIDRRLGELIAISQVVAYIQTGSIVKITSGFRSPARQLELINKWDAGNRTGLVTRPAVRSWHMQRLAVDVSTEPRPTFEVFRQVMLMFDGVRWGGNFRRSDPVHFDLPRGRAKSVTELLTS